MTNEDFRKIAEHLARLVMQIIEGNHLAVGKADELVKRNFPDIYEEYE